MDNIEQIIKEIKSIAKKYSEINKIILFGSRARGDNVDRSDIDLAVFSNDYTFKKSFDFKTDIETEVSTLLKFDILCVDGNTDEKLLGEINNEGVIIYEKS